MLVGKIFFPSFLAIYVTIPENVFEAPQYGLYFEGFYKLPALCFIFQSILRALGTAVFLFELHQVSQGKRWLRVP